MRILLIKDENTYDITKSVVTKFTISGSKQKAPRIFSFKFLTTKNGEVDIINGDKVILLNNEDKELFRGIILNNNINKDGVRDLKVYDMMFYLNANKDTFVFRQKKASDIFKEVCKRFEIPVGTVDDSGYVIDNLTCKNKTAYDIIIEVMAITYKNTNKRFYTRSSEGVVNFLKRREQAQVLVIETGVNLNDYNITEDSTKIANRVKLITTAGALDHVVVKNDKVSQEKFGVIQYFERQSEFIRPSATSGLADAILKEKSIVNKKMSVKCLGDDSIISGNAVILNIPDLNISKAFYVDSDSHTYDDGFHEMSLTLTETNEV